MTEPADSTRWDESYDIVVVGSGAGGLSCALTAATCGARVLVVEKTPYFGGGCAVSGGVVWIPANAAMQALGMSDSIAAARRYLQRVIGPRARWDLIDTYLENGPRMLDFMDTRTSLRLIPRPIAPDYYAEEEGAASGGRMLDPAVFDGRELGPLFAQLRPPLPSFMIFGGMMVNKTDIGALLKSYRSWPAFRHAAALLLRYARDRLFYPRGTRLVVGNALAAGLLKATSQTSAALWNNSSVQGLVRRGGRVSGVEIVREGRRLRIEGRRGVVLATGGAPGDPEYTRKYIPFAEHHQSMAPPSNCGDGIRLALSVGARMDDVNRDNAFWTPVSIMRRADGSTLKFAHLITDRQKPGLIALNQRGERFTNESASYHDFVAAMHAGQQRSPAVPAYLICDSHFLRKYGLGLVRPGPGSHRRFLRDGYLLRATDLRRLAELLQVPFDNLRQSVEANNRYALTGVDSDFGRGSSAYHRYLGDPEHGPNPCIGPISKPPFYAVRVYPGDIGTSRGVRTDAQARPLDVNGQPIPGLYVCGNDMNSVMAGTYPSGGITLGPAMTFGYVIGRSLTATSGTQATPERDDDRLLHYLRESISMMSPVATRHEFPSKPAQQMVDADFNAPAADADTEHLRLWTNERCVVASRSQSAMLGFRAAVEESDAAGWPVVTRRSGGSAVVHRPGILNVTWRKRSSSADWNSGYEQFLGLLVGALERFGLRCDYGPVANSACDGRFNLRCQGRKLAGTAAYAGGSAGGQRYCLFHAAITVFGSIDADLSAIRRFEGRLGIHNAYATAAHVSLSELSGRRYSHF